MIHRSAKKAGLTPEELLAEKARVARAKSARASYRHHGRLRKTVNRGRVAELARAAQRSLILAKYHADPDNWSTRRKRRRIFERDGWRCRSCGKTVSDQVNAGDPRRAVAGHIVAAATGGDWSDENIATLCHPCNVADGVNQIPIQAHLAW
jgi:5-methylcytosine-specific restriction endonuclease McrA